MNTNDIDQERAEFEAACRGHVDDAGYDEEALNLVRDGDGYIDTATQAAWWGWREGRAALQSQDREDAERYRCLSSMATQQADSLGPIFRIDVRRTPQTMFNFDAAVDHARRIEGKGK